MVDTQRAHILAELESVPANIRAQWKQAFDAFDKNGNGFIELNELAQIMVSMRMIPAHGEVDGMISAVDHNMDNMVDFGEFEMMMVSAGRGRPGTPIGFSHVVERQIRIAEVAELVTKECATFMDHFCRAHATKFLDLPPGGKVMVGEESQAWYDTHKQFQEELELMVQNLMMLWGVSTQQHFQEDFVEACLRTDLKSFLTCADYSIFLRQMSFAVESIRSGGAGVNGNSCVPHETPKRMHSKALTRLSEVDTELAALDKRRNELLAERRRLIGCEVELNTTTALRRELETRQYREDVGLD
eukprot:CAMPEP_0178417926 /NCGR_PEP_ID=MMETSP0689_2-20121128/24824_1 /TAXON_ID=160604 /ORGANISM="Amphidinium massartii, Strain CS-259" /LENGTH=300 /DNA_ID=CAMNT_0020039303 /DNA_START=117 /DNA_END=1019 /DNA_ORIENTATION=-